MLLNVFLLDEKSRLISHISILETSQSVSKSSVILYIKDPTLEIYQSKIVIWWSPNQIIINSNFINWSLLTVLLEPLVRLLMFRKFMLCSTCRLQVSLECWVVRMLGSPMLMIVSGFRMLCVQVSVITDQRVLGLKKH